MMGECYEEYVDCYLSVKGDPEAVERCQDEFFVCVEAEGRRRASERDELPESDADFLNDMKHAARDLASRLSKYQEAVSGEESKRLDTLKTLGKMVRNAAEGLRRRATICLGRGEPRKDCILDEDEMLMMKWMDSASKLAIGKRCTWLLGEVEPYNLSSALNDLTACYHRFLEKSMEFIDRVEDRVEAVGKCLWRKERTNPKLVEACRVWDWLTERLSRDLYEIDDYEALSWYSFDDKAEIRVGSSPGHKTHLDLKKGELKYYDTDLEVNKVMAWLLEVAAGLDCTWLSEGVECGGLTEDKLEAVAKVLAAPTSMDYRLMDPENYWPEEYWDIDDEGERFLKLLEEFGG